MPIGGYAMTGGYRRQYRAIGGVWRAEADETENYTYAIALQIDT